MRSEGSPRLLGLFAHPDDESFSAAGALAAHARRGIDVTVASLTRGEAGTSFISTDDLAQLRCDELAASCDVLGINAPVILDLPDGGLADLELQNLVSVISDLLLRQRPDVVLTLGRDGVYGHRDHIATTVALDFAVRALPVSQRVRVVHAEFPRGLFRPLWKILRRVEGFIDPLVVAEAIGIERAFADFRVRISDDRDRKLASIACYRSQLPGADPLSFLRPGLISGLLDEEWFTIASGPQNQVVTDNLFAGLS